MALAYRVIEISLDAQNNGGLGFVPDDDDGHEEVIKTLRL
jgi:hypothetical protein